MTTAKRRHTKCGNTRHSASRAKGGSTRKLWIESGREQKWSSRFSSRLIVPRLGRESHIRGSAGQRLWRFAFLRDREGLVSSPPKPVSEFAPTKLKQARGHADTARVRDPRGWMRTWWVSFCDEPDPPNRHGPALSGPPIFLIQKGIGSAAWSGRWRRVGVWGQNTCEISRLRQWCRKPTVQTQFER